MLIATINNSSLVSDADVNTMTKAVAKQLSSHVAPAWFMKAPTMKFYADKSQVPSDAWLISIVDDDTSVPGALGYHDLENGYVRAYIIVKPVLDNGGVVLYDATNPQNVSVSSVLSHEAIEAFLDRYAGFWSDGPKIVQGNEYALEGCDAVEGDSYVVNVLLKGKVSVSNFILPTWFDMQATSDNGTFDYLGKLSKPFSMTAGGYMIVRSAGKVKQVFAEGALEWKKKLKQRKLKKGLSRLSQRAK